MKIKQKQYIDKYFGYLLIGLFLPVTRLLGILLNRNHSIKKTPKKIIFLKILGLGSLVLALDAIKKIKEQYPDSKLILITDENIANGIKPFNVFDEVWEIKTNSVIATFKTACLYLLKTWKLSSVWIVDLEVYSKLTTVYSLFTFAVNRFGFHLFPVYFRKYLNTHNVNFNQFTCLEDNYLKMAEAVTGLQLASLQTVPGTKKLKKNIYVPFIAINNTCSDLASVRKMSVETIEQICTWIINNSNYSIALLGAPSDAASNDLFINDHCKHIDLKRIVNYAGNNGFEAYYTFLQYSCDFIISIDSAPLHIAKKLGLPSISVWGPTNPDSYLKIRDDEKHLHLTHYSKAICSPCVHHTTSLPCKGHNICMTEIDSQQIIELIKQMITTINNPI